MTSEIDVLLEDVWKRFGHFDALKGTVRRQVGMVFQQFNLFPHLTAIQNVALSPQESLGLSRREAEARAAHHAVRRANLRT